MEWGLDCQGSCLLNSVENVMAVVAQSFGRIVLQVRCTSDSMESTTDLSRCLPMLIKDEERSGIMALHNTQTQLFTSTHSNASAI